MLGLGMTAQEMLWSAVGAEADPNSHGRQMPSHWGTKRLERSVAVVVHRLAGAAFGRCGRGVAIGHRWSKDLQDKVNGFKGDEVVYMSVGDGTTSEGEWWEALNTACNLKLPVIFRRRRQRLRHLDAGRGRYRGRRHLETRRGFSGPLYSEDRRHRSARKSTRHLRTAVEYCRARKGPAFVHAKVIRPYSHSLSDDEKLYRPDEEREAEAAIDPIKTFAEFLMTEGIASSEDLGSTTERGRRRGQ